MHNFCKSKSIKFYQSRAMTAVANSSPISPFHSLLPLQLRNISNTIDSISSGYPIIEKTVENTTRSGVFLTKFEVLG